MITSESRVSGSEGSLDGVTGAGEGHVPSPASVKVRRRRTSWRERVEITLFSAPAIVVFLTFVIVPVGMAAYYGFYRWKGYGPPTTFVGFHNYKVIFGDPAFRHAVLHNFEIVGLSLLIQGPIAIGLALLLNRKMRGRTVLRVLIFTPWVVSEVIAGTGWSMLLPVQGAVNECLTKLHIFGTVNIDWLGNPHLAIWTLMMILTWKYIGFAVILLLAGLQNIPEELYEAASLDGASYWQVQRRITVPLLAPTIRIWAFLSIIGALQLFDLIYIIWGQHNPDVFGISTMATYMVENGPLAQLYGYGNAVAVVLFLISLVVAVTYQRFVLRRDMVTTVTERKDAR